MQPETFGRDFPGTLMATSSQTITARRSPSQWRGVLVVAAVTLFGTGLSQARASCGDYLHSGPTTSKSPVAKPMEMPSPSPCSHGRCDKGPTPMPIPSAPVPAPVIDDLATMGWSLPGRLIATPTRYDRDLRDLARPGYPSRIDRPPRS